MSTKFVFIPEFLEGGGEAGEILRTRDWTATSLGEPASWPQSLKTCVRIILTSSQPMFVWWGPELINIYNDAYKAIVGGKHPQSFGAQARQVWKEIWSEIAPRVEIVMNHNIGTYDEALLLIMERNGYPEETYYTFSYSPIPGDEGGVGGIICANTNSTDLVINERAIETLRELGALNNEKTVESVYEGAASVLHKNNKDFPIAIFYKIDEEGKEARAVAWAGNPKDYGEFPKWADLTQPNDNTTNLCRAVESGQMTLVKNNGRRIHIPKGYWDRVPSEFLHLPIFHPNKKKPLVVLSVGLNPYRPFNEVYKNFIKLVADQVSRVLNNVISHEEERKRSAALALSKKILEASERRYRELIQNLPIAIYTTDLKGRIELYNQAAVDLWGCEPRLNEDLWCGNTAMYTADGMTPVSLSDSPMTRVLNGQAMSNEEIIIRKPDGTKILMQVNSALIRDADGNTLGAIHMLSDITNKRATQEELERIIEERTKSLRIKNEELKKSEERYHRMTEEVQDYAIILLDKDGTILNWNSGARKIKGYTDEEIIGKNFRIFYLQEDLESYVPEKLISQATETGRASSEGWRVRKNGTTFWSSVVITALHDDKNNIIGFSKLTRDLTEKKRAEDTMRKYMTELERQNAELEQFAYVSSHDLQEPLRKIRTFAELLEGEVLEETQRNYLRKINSSAERMSNLIKDLLNYSRLSKEGEEFVSVDLNRILENVKTDLEVVIRQTDAQIFNDPLPVVKGIPLQFNQLFLNLLSNALKFNTGRPIINIRTFQAPLFEIIPLKLDLRWSYIKIVFSDNGIGFEPQFSEQIFTIFQRLNTRQKFTGTGVGLAMCKKIVENHQGYICAEGDVDKGAAFTIYFPLK